MSSAIRFDWQDLQLLIAAGETGSIAGAAERCNTVASAASKRLSDLESALGAALLERSSRGVALTPAGEALARRARGLIEQALQVQGEIAGYASGMRGSVRLFANISSIVEFLPAALAGFAQRHPDIRVQLEEAVSERVVQAVAEHVADLGVVSERLARDGLAFFPFRRDQLQLIVPRGHALAGYTEVRLADALDHPFIGLHAGSALHGQLLRAAAALGRELRLAMQVTSFDAVCAMVATGLGVGVVPRAASAAHVAELDLIGLSIAEPWAERQLYLCARDEPMPPGTQHLFDHLKAIS
ncbi:LysR family transcriptional regulator [Uliginosibacterium sp. sgz301328]|uniref:LysR family transcriptional regulator n=1 Tax=Uliginosibacterium sp. sgz301328 TaxID=3243764 RepID=UPI00359E6597